MAERLSARIAALLHYAPDDELDPSAAQEEESHIEIPEKSRKRELMKRVREESAQ
jgi:hypothetical protein